MASSSQLDVQVVGFVYHNGAEGATWVSAIRHWKNLCHLLWIWLLNLLKPYHSLCNVHYRGNGKLCWPVCVYVCLHWRCTVL